MKVKEISVAKDFNIFPGPRFISLGPNSGEAFREQILKPALGESFEKIIVNLDGTMGYGSSFLEEAFGGLVRQGYSIETLLGIFEFVSTEEPELIEDIIEYIKNAKP